MLNLLWYGWAFNELEATIRFADRCLPSVYDHISMSPVGRVPKGMSQDTHVVPNSLLLKILQWESCEENLRIISLFVGEGVNFIEYPFRLGGGTTKSKLVTI